MILRSALLPMMLAAPLAAAAQSSGLWHYQFNQGIGEYSTGAWDSATGGALAISCGPGGSTRIAVQVKGQAPPPHSRLRFTAASRAGSHETRFVTDARGDVTAASPADPAFRQFWADLRARDIVTVRYADGRTIVHSLGGAAGLLPAKPCG